MACSSVISSRKIKLVAAQHILRNEKALAQVFSAQLSNEILPRYEAGNVYSVAEKVVLNSVDLTIYIIILFRCNTNKFFKIRRYRHSAGYGKRHSVRLFRKSERTGNSRSSRRIIPTPFSSCVCSS